MPSESRASACLIPSSWLPASAHWQDHHAAWRSKPSYYAISTEDRTINPDLERFMAKRMGAKTIEVKASRLSLISRSEEITRLILEATGHKPNLPGRRMARAMVRMAVHARQKGTCR